ncbi:MAG TPA: [protein-PII] uridylyltransferase [Gammaproteobacteria bacterium]
MGELFDADTFATALASSANPLKLFRDTLRQGNERLAERFLANEPIVPLVTGRAAFIDQLLVHAWRHCLGPDDEARALVAVGGYGRGELHPHSDIDLMLLVTPEERERSRESIERFLLFLWDMGLEVGHSVRTLEECVEQAGLDITVATNLMESRLLLGSAELFKAMRKRTGPKRLWPSRDFFAAKWQEQIARHHKFHDTAYNLEPNIKEGPGGLRDIQMIGWVAKRHFNAVTLDDLVDHGFLTAHEYRTLINGQNLLWRIRYGLHLLTKRREDRLLFDLQRSLAKQFDYSDGDGRLAVEHFMKEYYRTVMELSRLNEMLLQLFQEKILHAEEPGKPKSLNKRFQVRKGFLEMSHDKIFERYPFALLELFLVMAQHPELKGVRAETIRLVRSYTPLIDDKFRNDLRCRALFMELLRQPRGVSQELHRMSRYGILAAYLPAFGQVVGQMQHDMFHVYTVDEHTLFVVSNLRRLTVREFYDEFPLCSSIMERIPKPELLYIAALFHDIAKGRGGDHSELGTLEVEQFCHHHLLSSYDTRVVSWLVKNHLLMSTTAQRKDISDPEVINTFAGQVGDQPHLDHLYLLTVADIRATSPSVWNSWKDALLAELYHNTRDALRRGLANPIRQQEWIEDTQQEARELLHKGAIPDTAIAVFWQRLHPDYFLRYSADEIAWHTRSVLQHGESREPLVMIRQQTERGGTEIFIYTPIQPHQFAVTTAALDQLGLTIVDARIIPSRDDYTLDTYIVLEENGEAIRNSYRVEEINRALRHLLANPEAAPLHINRRMARQLKHFPIPTQVLFQRDPHNARTIMEVVTSDRPGLLLQIARALTHCGVRLQNAKIATFGARAEDIFFISDGQQQPVENSELQSCLRRTITQALDGMGERNGG